jgi:2-polyprenyl-6-methoxyphenol hydroxylase-like FAD-dependent oxidoreductase
MAHSDYDAIVVGARCAGSPTALLLARKGYRVLLVDRATFPSDTISTHLIHPPGVAALQRWGLLERVAATGCPAIDTYLFDMGPFTLTGSPGTAEAPVAYAPRRTVLDKLLVEAAAKAGVEVREGFTVDELLVDDGRVSGIRGHGGGGSGVVERARIVVGADGFRSLVAGAVGAEAYRERSEIAAGYYTYWSGVPTHGRFEAYDRPSRGFAVWPTNDDLTLVVVGWPYAEFETNKRDVERHYLEAIDLAPAFAERLRAGTREDRYYGMAVPNFFRKPFGPGWALVGDAGYNKDFMTAQGISDAFRDVDLAVAALDAWLSGRRPFDEVMSAYQRARDEHVLPMYEFTCQFAAMQPPPPEMQQLMGAVHGNQEAMDGFARVVAGVLSPAEFFSEANVGRILSEALPARQ